MKAPQTGRGAPPARPSRLLASLLAALCLAPVAPGAARADDDAEVGLWTRWWEGATNRELAAEIPFAVLVTLPAMLVVTPIWLVARGIASLSGEEERGDA